MALVFDQRVSGFTFHAAAHGPQTEDCGPFPLTSSPERET